MVHQRGNLGVGVHVHKTATKLIAILNIDQPGIVLSPLVTFLKQLLQHHRDLHPVGRGQGVHLQGVLTDRQCLVVCGAGNGAINIGKLATAFLVPFPDPGWRVGIVRHVGSKQNKCNYYCRHYGQPPRCEQGQSAD